MCFKLVAFLSPLDVRDSIHYFYVLCYGNFIGQFLSKEKKTHKLSEIDCKGYPLIIYSFINSNNLYCIITFFMLFIYIYLKNTS